MIYSWLRRCALIVDSGHIIWDVLDEEEEHDIGDDSDDNRQKHINLVKFVLFFLHLLELILLFALLFFNLLGSGCSHILFQWIRNLCMDLVGVHFNIKYL